MKQSQFDILFNMLNELKRDNILLNNKIDSGLKEVNHRLDHIESDVKEIKTILKKHDNLFVEHGWLAKSSF